LFTCLIGNAVAHSQQAFRSDFEAGITPWNAERPQGYEHGSITVQNQSVLQGQRALRFSADKPNSVIRLVSPRIELTGARNLAFNGWYRLQGENNVLELRFRSLNAQGVYMEPWQDYFQFHRLTASEDWSEFSVPLSIHA